MVGIRMDGKPKKTTRLVWKWKEVWSMLGIVGVTIGFVLVTWNMIPA